MIPPGPFRRFAWMKDVAPSGAGPLLPPVSVVSGFSMPSVQPRALHELLGWPH